MKSLVETTGNFQLLNSEVAQLIRHQGYTLVSKDQFVHGRVVLGQIRSVAEVNDEATDEEWLKYVAESDGDLDLAVASFQSSFPVEGKKQEQSVDLSKDTKAGGSKSAAKKSSA